uniref:hypothetical protein n=1 Tax=Flavobacterium sp. TaxID=239 RepID=UPI00404B3BAF
MLDELDLLKKDWKKNENSFKQVDELEIYRMIHKRSSSVVKWIFYISIIELFFWIAISLYMKFAGFLNDFKAYDSYYFLTVSEIISYGIIIYFIYLFYCNYRSINTSNSAKELINSILKTRKTVLNYVKIILVYSFISSLVGLWIQFHYDTNFLALTSEVEEKGNLLVFYVAMAVVMIIFMAVLIGIIWGFYKIIYGWLLKKLKYNYEELKKIDN